MDVVWLKRDVRLCDHEPLTLAAQGGRQFLVLYVYEPDQLAHASVHGSHVAFVNEGLAELQQKLRSYAGGDNSGVTLKRGYMTDVLDELHRVQPIARLLSHQETGHGASFKRDKRVKKWCTARAIDWIEIPQSTVVRGLSPSRSPWLDVWKAAVDSYLDVEPKPDPFDGPDRQNVLSRLVTFDGVGLCCATELKVLHSEDRAHRQRGGESRALELLRSFLGTRGEGYSGGISSPNVAWESCSRLSPYMSWGHISIRTIWRAVEQRRQTAKGKWSRSLAAFLTRLHWRGHNIQKFEMRCWMEHRSLCEAWEHLRDGQTFIFGARELLGTLSEADRIKAFDEGRTGYPMVDACMRCLLKVGWLNFRMRCMLVSFAIYNLWLDWRAVASHMARVFLDYEPGIHYSQLQMQAATTGVDMRCYSVTKQAKEQDPKGDFIKRYVPELASVPEKFIHEPWRLKGSDAIPAETYPPRIVDELKTSKAAKSAISVLQKWAQSGAAARGEAPPVLDTPVKTTKREADRIDVQLPEESSQKRARQGSIFSVLFARGSKADETTDNDSSTGSAAVAEQATPWTCPRCTLINAVADDGKSPVVCDACDAPRPAASTERVVIELD